MDVIHPIPYDPDPKWDQINQSIKDLRERIMEAMSPPYKYPIKGAEMSDKTLEQQIKEAEATKAPPVTLPLRVTKIKEAGDSKIVRIFWETSESDKEVTLSQVKKLMEEVQPGLSTTIDQYRCRQLYNEKFKGSWVTVKDRD